MAALVRAGRADRRWLAFANPGQIRCAHEVQAIRGLAGLEGCGGSVCTHRRDHGSSRVCGQGRHAESAPAGGTVDLEQHRRGVRAWDLAPAHLVSLYRAGLRREVRSMLRTMSALPAFVDALQEVNA